MIQNQTQGLLFTLSYLIEEANINEIQQLLSHLDQISQEDTHEIISIIQYMKSNFLNDRSYTFNDIYHKTLSALSGNSTGNKEYSKSDISESQKQFLHRLFDKQRHRMMMVQSGGMMEKFELDPSVLYLVHHWREFKRIYTVKNPSHDESNDIPIFYYWLYNWMKVADSIHDFTNTRSTSVNSLSNNPSGKKDSKFQKLHQVTTQVFNYANITQLPYTNLSKQDILHAIFEHSNDIEQEAFINNNNANLVIEHIFSNNFEESFIINVTATIGIEIVFFKLFTTFGGKEFSQKPSPAQIQHTLKSLPIDIILKHDLPSPTTSPEVFEKLLGKYTKVQKNKDLIEFLYIRYFIDNKTRILEMIENNDVSESFVEWIQLLDHCQNYIIHSHHWDWTSVLTQNRTIRSVFVPNATNNSIALYSILRMNQAILETDLASRESRDIDVAIPIEIDATERKNIFEKWFLPFTSVSNGFHLAITILKGDPNYIQATRHVRIIMYMSLFVIHNPKMSHTEKQSLYQEKIVPMIQQLESLPEVQKTPSASSKFQKFRSMETKVQFTSTPSTFLQVVRQLKSLIEHMFYHAGILSIPSVYHENLDVLDVRTVFERATDEDVRNLETAQTKLNVQPESLSTSFDVFPQLYQSIKEVEVDPKRGKTIVTRILKQLQNWNECFQQLSEDNLREIQQLESQNTHNERHIQKIQKLQDIQANIDNVIEDITQYIHTYQTDTSSITKDTIQTNLKTLHQKLQTTFASNYLFGNLKNIYWSHSIINTQSDASLWDASIKNTKESYTCSTKPTGILPGNFQKKLASNYFIRLNGIHESFLQKCNAIQQVVYQNKRGNTVTFTHIQPKEFHSVSFLTHVIQVHRMIRQSTGHIKAMAYIKEQVANPSLDMETKYIFFLLQLPWSTIFAIKRYGDWGQIQHCIQNRHYFVTFDRLALFWAYFQGCGFFGFGTGEDNHFYTCPFYPTRTARFHTALQTVSFEDDDDESPL